MINGKLILSREYLKLENIDEKNITMATIIVDTEKEKSKLIEESDEIKEIENRSDERIENLTITEVDGKPIPKPDPLQALKDQIVLLLNGHDFESMDVFNKDPEKIFISITLKKEGKK